MRLPNAENAFIADEKLRKYCLNSGHDEGQHKAYLFAKLLGITTDNLGELRSMVEKIIRTEEVVVTQKNEYGTTYKIDSTVFRHERVFRVRTIWIIRDNEDFPRFVSCYIIRKKSIGHR